jgi:AsmA-like protein
VGAAVALCLLLALAVYGGARIAVRVALGSDFIRATLESQLTAHLGQPVRIASAGASLFPRAAVELGDVTIGSPPIIKVRRARVVTGLRGLFSRTIADAELIISDGRIELPAAFALIPAAATEAAAPAGSSFTITSVRVISFRDVDLIAGGRTVHVDLDSSIAGDRLDVATLTARASNSRVTAHGAFTSLARVEGSFDGKSPRLDLDELLAIASAMTSPQAAAPGPRPARAQTTPPTPMHLTLTVGAASGQFATYEFRDLMTRIDLIPGRVLLSPMSVRAFGGDFRGQLQASTAGEVPELRLTGRVDALDVADLMKASGSTGGVTGRLAGTVSLTAEGADAATVMRRAHGTIDAAITNGTMPHLDMVREVVLAFGKPLGAPPAGSGSAFSRLGGAFALARWTVTSQNLALASRDFDMRGRGTVHLAGGEVEARADVILSKDLTAQAGTDLRRYAQEDGRVVVPATIAGTLERPQVSLDVAAATQRAVEGELKRRATGWLDGLLKKKKGGGD